MGLDLGLERTGRFATLAVVEIDIAACETIRINHRKGLLAALAHHNPAWVTLEPTGAYHLPLLRFLTEKGFPMALVTFPWPWSIGSNLG